MFMLFRTRRPAWPRLACVGADARRHRRFGHSIRLAQMALWATALIASVVGALPCSAQTSGGWPLAWGSRESGQLGDSYGEYGLVPVRAAFKGANRVAGGYEHSLALRQDGTVWAWGYNGYGELGDGTTSGGRTVPWPVSGLWDVVAVAAGYHHNLAVKADGTVWAWGSNYFMQIGDGLGGAYRKVPVAVSGLTGVVAVAAGIGHSLALRADGTVWAWGANYDGELGDGTLTNRPTPVAVSGLSNVIAVAANGEHSMALKSDGTVWGWGNNQSGQIGDGTTTRRRTPVAVSGLTGVVAIAAGRQHSLALKADGSLWAWGQNTSGQLGDGTETHRYTPVAVTVMSDAVSVAAGEYFTVAVKADGTVWTWGENYYGQLGNGTRSRNTTAVPGLTGAVTAGAGCHHTLVVEQGGGVWAFGHNALGQLGHGMETPRTTPGVVPGLTDVVSVAAGESFSLALRSDGSVWQWGFGPDGWRYDLRPTAVSNVSGVTSVSAGASHRLAVQSDGTVMSWGSNEYGQLGRDGAGYWFPTPQAVYGLAGVSAAAGGGRHSLALKSDGTVWAWGANDYGQIGDGTTTRRDRPRQVTGLTDVVAIAAGNNHSLAVKSDGTVWGWGANINGQIGDGGGHDRTVPVMVPDLTDVVAVAAGTDYSLAVKSDGTAWGWGSNGDGRIGCGTGSPQYSPVMMSGLTGVVSLAAGRSHSLAIKSDGTVWACGDNANGQLGDGTTTTRYRPVVVPGLQGAIAVSAGGYHSLAVSSIRAAQIEVPVQAGAPGQSVSLTARLYSGNDAMGGRTLDCSVGGTYVGSAVTDNSGWALVPWTLPSGMTPNTVPVDFVFAGAPDLLRCDGRGWVNVEPARTATELYVPERTGTITEAVILRGFLRRSSDLAAIDGKTVGFRVDGSVVGSAITGATGSPGRADLTWTITEGPASRVLGATFSGDSTYAPCNGVAPLTCQSWTTKMATFDRTQRITGKTELKCRLLRSDNVPLYDRTIDFSVDGTFVISRPTNTQGYASYPHYTVPDGAGAGERTIQSSFTGNAGYASCSKTAKLTVLKATPYIWVMPRSVPQGGTARLYAYFRRLADYQKQEGKTVTFRIDGTWIADVVTLSGAEAGIARYSYTTVEPPGVHTVRCEFAGDAWVDEGFGEASLTIL